MNANIKNLDEFMVAKNGGQFGPFQKTKLIENLRNGNLGLDDMIWQPGMAQWEPIRFHLTREEMIQAGFTEHNMSQPRSPREVGKTFAHLFDLHPTVSTVAIIADLMIFFLAVPTLGLIIFSVILLAIITFLFQKNQYGDSTEDAIAKTAIIVLFAGIPVPICTAVILYYKFFGKKSLATT